MTPDKLTREWIRRMPITLVQLTEYEALHCSRRLVREIAPVMLVPDLGECWMWQGAKFGNGYGKIVIRGRHLKAHRLVLILSGGDRELEACHKCDQPGCVRPDHLFWGTHAENMQDSGAKGRVGLFRNPEKACRGERHWLRKNPSRVAGENNNIAKLTASQAREIKERYLAGGIFQKTLAEEYGVTQTTVGRIVRGESYAS